MPDARAHAARCQDCSAQLYLWDEISRLAPGLHEDWEAPRRCGRGFAPRLPPQAPRPNPTPVWRWALAAAALLALAVALFQPWRTRPPEDRAFLTENALREVEQAETAYARSIDNLSKLAQPSLEQSPAPLAAAYREKLVLLDSAIADLKANIENNRYNVYLQAQLATLYRDKQGTLKEWLDHAQKN